MKIKKKTIAFNESILDRFPEPDQSLGIFEIIKLLLGQSGEMVFFDVLGARCSHRSFDSRRIEPEKIRTILDAINSAPSAGNLQAYQVILVQDKSELERLQRAALNQRAISEAPLAIVFCAEPLRSSIKYRQRGAELYCIQDATIATTFAHLAATALGLSSVWIGAFDDDQVIKILDLGPGLKPIAILPIGYAKGQPDQRTPRRELDDLVKIR